MTAPAGRATPRPESARAADRALAAAYPTGAQLRAWTRRRTRFRRDTTAWDTFSDVYTVLLSAAVALGMGVGLARGLAGDAAEALAAGATAGRYALVLLDPTWLVVVAAALLVAATWSVTARTGPVGAPRHWRAWWLSAPGERRTLLRPALAAPALAAAGIGLLAGLALGFTVPAAATAASVLALTLGTAALAVAGVAVQALAQVRAGQRPPGALVYGTDALLALVIAGGVALALLRPGPLVLPAPGVLVAVAGVAVALAAVTLWAADRATDRLRARALHGGGDVAAESAGALNSMDTRALGRALDRAPGPAAARGTRPGAERSWSVSRVVRSAAARAPRPVRPHAALVAADLVLLVRTPRHLAQVVAGALVVVLALAVPGGPWFLIVGLFLGAYVAALALAEGARQGQLAPALDALLPLGQRAVRATRLVLPGVVMAVWGAAVLTLTGGQLVPLDGLPAAAVTRWAGLGALAGVGVAAGALRGAYRPLPDFGGQPIVTPMGVIPPGLTATISTGPDVAILSIVPVAVAIVLGTVPPVLLGVQALVTVAAVIAGLWHQKDS